ncbi:MAG TPA: hypothetical protein EYQ63_25810 [Fuerstia sp.]|nr:hypothetical protein [Fuerstiella sp.]
MSEPAESRRPFASRCRRAGRNLVMSIAFALVIAFVVEATVAQSFYAATDGVSPEVPMGARVLAYRLASEYSPGDIVVYEDNERFVLSRVTAIADDGRQLTVHKNDQPETQVSMDHVVGRVVLSTR